MSFYDVEHWVQKGLSENDAELKVKDLKERTNRFRIEYWLRKGLTEEESKKKISEIQKENSLKVNQKNKPNPTRIDYWLNKGYDFETAREKLKERQSTFTLEKCIKKHGVIEGTKIYNERQLKWQETLNKNNNSSELNIKRGIKKQNYIKKHSEEKYNEIIKIKRICSSKEWLVKKYGEQRYFDKINKIKKSFENRGFNKISKISSILFQEIEIDLNDKCYYGKDEQIIHFNVGEEYFCFFVDFKFGNKIIEFYGDYWHGNPTLYKPDDTVGYKKTKVSKIWERDLNRINLIEKKGYDVLIVWENDYKNNKEETKNKCIKWIKNL